MANRLLHPLKPGDGLTLPYGMTVQRRVGGGAGYFGPNGGKGGNVPSTPNQEEKRNAPPPKASIVQTQAITLGNTYMAMRIISAVMHLTATIVTMAYWTQITYGARAPNLTKSATFTTDYTSMLDSISNMGMVTTPASLSMTATIAAHALPGAKPLTVLSKAGMLEYAQPVMIRSRHGNTSSFVPDRCRGIALVDDAGVAIASTNASAPLNHLDYSSWRACRAVDAPAFMMDMPYPYTTLTTFGQNNMLALMYNTLLITAAISVAVLPVPARGNKLRGTLSIAWIALSEVMLAINFVMMMAFPFSQMSHYLPPNNAILACFLNLLSMVAVVCLARARPEEGRLSRKDGDGGTWSKIRFLGTHLVREPGSTNGRYTKVFRREATGQILYINPKDDPGDADNVPEGTVVDDTDDSTGESNDKEGKAVVAVTHSGTAALIPNGIIEEDFVDFLVNNMSMVTVRYFEYSMTAGLFLVSVLLTMYPNGESYLYHTVYQGMMACNLVAIPLTKGIVGACKVNKKGDANLIEGYRWLIPTGLSMILVSSCTFFLASFVPFSMSISAWLQAGSGMPDAVRHILYAVMAIFCAFSAFGIVTIGVMIGAVSNPYPSGDKNDAQNKVMRWLRYQLIGFELLNFGKFIIAFWVVSSALASIGL